MLDCELNAQRSGDRVIRTCFIAYITISAMAVLFLASAPNKADAKSHIIQAVIRDCTATLGHGDKPFHCHGHADEWSKIGRSNTRVNQA
jgi:hypothetical protein